MKRLTLLAAIAALSLTTLPAFAQDTADLITLNDATPSPSSVGSGLAG